MLSLEIIFVLGALYSFLIYAMVKTQQAQREARPRPKIGERQVALDSLIAEEGTRHEVAEETA